MKENILVIDEDIDYSKKFCNQGNKLYGDKYLFLYFSNLKSVKEYIEDNKKSNLIISSHLVNSLDDMTGGLTFILNEDEKEIKRDGRRTQVYKLQNVKNILKLVDEDLNQIDGKLRTITKGKTKIVIFYATDYVKNKFELVKRIAKYISKKCKVLIVDLDEFENYKGKSGLSNIIFNYKEDRLDTENIEKEIEIEKNLLIIKSVTYPEDMSVISSIDLANIIEKMTDLSYDFIFINADTSYVRSEYIFKMADEIVLIKEGNDERADKMKTHLRNDNLIDISKICEINMGRVARAYLIEVSKNIASATNG